MSDISSNILNHPRSIEKVEADIEAVTKQYEAYKPLFKTKPEFKNVYLNLLDSLAKELGSAQQMQKEKLDSVLKQIEDQAPKTPRDIKTIEEEITTIKERAEHWQTSNNPSINAIYNALLNNLEREKSTSLASRPQGVQPKPLPEPKLTRTLPKITKDMSTKELDQVSKDLVKLENKARDELNELKGKDKGESDANIGQISAKSKKIGELERHLNDITDMQNQVKKLMKTQSSIKASQNEKQVRTELERQIEDIKNQLSDIKRKYPEFLADISLLKKGPDIVEKEKELTKELERLEKLKAGKTK